MARTTYPDLVATNSDHSETFPAGWNKCHSEGVPHVTVLVELVNQAGQSMIMKRRDKRWDTSVSGHSQFQGQAPENPLVTACRETFEELDLAGLGLAATPDQAVSLLSPHLRFICRCANQLPSSTGVNNEWVYLFRLHWPADWPDPCRDSLATEEGNNSPRWMEIGAVISFARANPMMINSSLRMLLLSKGHMIPIVPVDQSAVHSFLATNDLVSSNSLGDAGEPFMLVTTDIDGTVLLSDESFNDAGRPGRILKRLIAILDSRPKMILVFITGNDYEGRQSTRVVTPIVEMLQSNGKQSLLKRIIVFADGATRKFTYDSSRQEFREDTAFRDGPPRTYFTPDESTTINAIVQAKLDQFETANRADPMKLAWPAIEPKRVHSDPNRPDGNQDLKLVLSPVNVNRTTNHGNRSGLQLAQSFCEQLKDPHGRFAELNLVPTVDLDKSQGTIEITIRNYANFHTGMQMEPNEAQIIAAIQEYFPKFPLSLPSLQVRGSTTDSGQFLLTQLAIKPFKHQKMRVEFLNTLRDLHGATARLGGETTVDIQRAEPTDSESWVSDKRVAIRNLLQSWPNSVVTYFGNEFHPNGNDFPVADYSKQDGRVICVNVGEQSDVEGPGICNSGGGPEAFLAYLRLNYRDVESKLSQMASDATSME